MKTKAVVAASAIFLDRLTCGWTCSPIRASTSLEAHTSFRGGGGSGVGRDMRVSLMWSVAGGENGNIPTPSG
ncbi:hypothetical protein Pen02_71070 [Plantactinospora endophytica]|uniref:Secreted protein n=1 Tax=Plantactinospora endophytica TaxID=673535 RepID=A0ABQ4EBQ5_9ACTN|nr:hypothetical protein Pen02_71070 [Plantactinospora endophytica]